MGEEKVALIDTVKLPFVPELLERITEVLPLDRIDYIVVNHVEPDHNSGLRAVMEAIPRAKVVASAGGVRGVAEYHGPDLELTAVGPDDVIDLGGKTLRFLPMPMVHWPDSMFTYCAESATLMPNDAFGQHLATSERFADEIDLKLAVEELAIYYANILTPVAVAVGKAVSKTLEQGWDIQIIAPSHGVIWRHDQIPTIVDAYDRYIAEETEDKIVIAYTTMWGSTDVLAREIADGAAETGVDVVLYDIAITPLAHITRHLMDARALLVGSPTLHHGMLHRAASLLQYIWGIKPKNKIGGFWDEQVVCRTCEGTTYGITDPARMSPEAGGLSQYKPLRVTQLTWSSPMSNRLLLEAGLGTTAAGGGLNGGPDDAIGTSGATSTPVG